MIVWIVTKLACLMYGIEIPPAVKALFAFLSGVEMLLVTIYGVIMFVVWLVGRKQK